MQVLRLDKELGENYLRAELHTSKTLYSKLLIIRGRKFGPIYKKYKHASVAIAHWEALFA